MQLAQLFVRSVEVYMGVGLAFAAAFALRGAARIDPDAEGATWGFRLLLIPGATMLWPLLALRWWRGARPPQERTPHKRALTEGDQ